MSGSKSMLHIVAVQKLHETGAEVCLILSKSDERNSGNNLLALLYESRHFVNEMSGEQH